MSGYWRLYFNRGVADKRAGLPPAPPGPRRVKAREAYLKGYGAA